VPITFKADPNTADFALKGYAYAVTHSEISGGNWIEYDPKTPKTYMVPNANGLLADVTIAPPAAYVVPAQWQDVIARLDAHGVRYRRLSCPVRLQGTSYQISDPVWSERPFEGHHMLQTFKASRVVRDDFLPAGSVIVPLDQSAANVAIELLEPQAEDSLLRWGYLDAIFEPKEYGEPRVVEKLARDMLQRSPALAAEFSARLKSDPAFAAGSRQRLEFFFERSPWYAAQDVGRYPVLALDKATWESKPCTG
jgi:hypothetical protein